MQQTKREFVDTALATAKIAIDTFAFLRSDGFSVSEAAEIASEEAAEGASCFAGIGSCGGGGCKHS